MFSGIWRHGSKTFELNEKLKGEAFSKVLKITNSLLVIKIAATALGESP
jgi:hypothetical protein